MTRTLGSILLAVVTSAACSTSNHATDAGDGSGSNVDGSTAPDATLNAVGIESFGSANLFEYRDGSGAWQPVPAPGDNGLSTIEVANDYVVLALCAGDGSAFDAEMIAATVADGNQFLFCFDPTQTGTPPQTFDVTGTMKQAGTLELGEQLSSATANWSFTVPAPAGTYDLAAFDTARTSMLLQRNIAVSAALALPAVVDLANGTAMPSATPTLSGFEPDSTPSVDTQIFTANSSIDLGSGAGSSVALAPPSLLVANDFEEVTFDAFGSAGFQDIGVFSATGGAVTVPDTLTALPLIEGTTFTNDAHTVAVSWSSLPPVTNGNVELFVEANEQSQSMEATTAWLALHGASNLEFDTTADHYKAIWYIDPTNGFQASVTVQSSPSATVNVESGVGDPGSSLRARARARAKRLHRMQHAR